MSWASVTELISDLHLKSKPDDILSIRSEIKEKLTKVHSDTTNGTYESKESENLTYKLTGALNFLDDQNNKSNQLINIEQFSAITKVFSEALSKKETPSLEEVKNNFLTQYKSSQSAKFSLPRMGSGVFGGVCAFLFTFSGQLKDHPLIGKAASNPEFYNGLVGMFIIAGIFFISTWMLEWIENSKVEQLMSGKMKNKIFGNMLSEILRYSNQDIEKNVPIRFTLTDLSHQIERKRISQNQSEKIAKLHLQELSERGVIKEAEIQSIDPTYEINSNLAKEVMQKYRF